MSFETAQEFRGAATSEKVALVVLESSKRLVGWGVHSGSVYKLDDFNVAVISKITDSGVSLTEVSDLASVVAGTFFNDRDERTIYLRTSDSADPDTKFLSMVQRHFYSNHPQNVIAPDSLSGNRPVPFLGLLRSSSEFGSGLDDRQIGTAIDGTGSLSFMNDQDHWAPIYDKLTWDNKRAFVYSWSPSLPINEATRIFRGKIASKRWGTGRITFRLRDTITELKGSVSIPTLGSISGRLISDSLIEARQRTIYGYVFGHRPTSIDQVVESYESTGTIALSVGADTVTGTGTSFLAELSVDDEILVGTRRYTIADVTSDTAATLTENFEESTTSGVALKVVPSHPKRYANREWVVSGHALTQPTTTVTGTVGLTVIKVGSTTNIRAGDDLIVNGERTSARLVSGTTIRLNTSLLVQPPVGSTVVRPAITNVRIKDRLLIPTRDYTFDASTGRLTVDGEAEKNVAPIRKGRGSAAFSTGTRTVTGTSTSFESQISPGDWIRAKGQVDFFEVLAVDSDTSLRLRTTPTYTDTDDLEYKSPDVLEDEGMLTVDAMGRSDDGTSGGVLLENAAQIVKVLLEDAGIPAGEIDSDSFDAAEADATHRLGFALPANYADITAPKIREVVNQINTSVLGALVLDDQFRFRYRVLSPARDATLRRFTEADDLGFQVDSDSSRIVKTVELEYRRREADFVSGSEAVSIERVTSDAAQFLVESTKTTTRTTVLVDQSSARIFASRYSFLFGIATSVVELRTKLQAHDLSVTDRVQLSHPELFERVGSGIRTKVMSVQTAKKSAEGTVLRLEDFANALSQCATITENDAEEYDNASDQEKAVNGYITDNRGIVGNDRETHGLNLIW